MNTCGTCRWYRDLNVSESDRDGLSRSGRAIPMVCGVNPPTISLTPVQVDSLDPTKPGKVTVMAPQNLWPTPPESEPACGKYERKEG